MTAEITTFDPAALKKRVSDQTQAMFGMLIPEAEFSKMVEKEINAFFHDATQPYTLMQKNSGWNATNDIETNVSPFRLLVWNHCREQIASRFRKEWDRQLKEGTGPTAKFIKELAGSEAAGEEVLKSTQELLMQMVGQMFLKTAQTAAFSAVQSVANGLRNQNYVEIANAISTGSVGISDSELP